jgi:hypothetical protein
MTKYDLTPILKTGLITKFPNLADADVAALAGYLYEVNSILFFGEKGGGEGDILALIFGAKNGVCPDGTRVPKDSKLLKMRKAIINNDYNVLWNEAAAVYRSAAFAIVDYSSQIEEIEEENAVDEIRPIQLFEAHDFENAFQKVGNRWPKKVKNNKNQSKNQSKMSFLYGK